MHYLITEEKIRESEVSQEVKDLYSPFLSIKAIEINPIFSTEKGVQKGDKIIINLSEDKHYHATVTKVSRTQHNSIAIRAKVDNAFYSRFILISNNNGNTLGILRIIKNDDEVYSIKTAPTDGNTYIIQHDPLEDTKSVCLPDSAQYQEYDYNTPVETADITLSYIEKPNDDEQFQLTVNIDPPGSGSLYTIEYENNEFTHHHYPSGYNNYHTPGKTLRFLVTPENIPEYAGGSADNLYNEYNFFKKWTRNDGHEITGTITVGNLELQLERKKQRILDFQMPENDVVLTANFTIPDEQHIPDDPIDLIILYTDRAFSWINQIHDEGINDFMDLVMEYLNESFDDSLININITLRRHRLVNYNESGNLQTHLNRLRHPEDGYMDTVLRERYLIGADLVTLLVKDPGQISGGYVLGIAGGLVQAYLYDRIEGDLYNLNNNPARFWDISPEYNFASVVSLDHPGTINTYNFLLTFVHEIGHKLGAGHHEDDTNSISPPGPQMYEREYNTNDYKGYSKAYNYWTHFDYHFYRTVMSNSSKYNGIDHTRIGRFSNPYAYHGDFYETGNFYPDGTDAHNNAKTINFAAHHIANYRKRVISDGLYIILEKNHPNGGTVTVNGQVYEHGDLIGPFETVDTISISAEPNEEYPFYKWIVAGDAQIHDSFSEDTTITMEYESIVLLAHFGYQVELSTFYDRGIVQGDGYYPSGEEITISCSPIVGDWTFVRWQDNNSPNPHETDLPLDLYSPENTFEMPSYNISLTAIFSHTDVYTLNTWVVPYFAGTISINNSDLNLFEPGDLIELSANAHNDNFCFLNWSSEDIDIEYPNNQDITIEMPDSDIDIYANFGYMATFTVEPEGAGTIITNPDNLCFSSGDIYDIEAIPNEGYMFSYWSTSVNAQISDNQEPHTSIIMPGYYITVTAHFSETYSVSLGSYPEDIEAVLEGEGNYIEGEIINISAILPKGYSFSHWSGDYVELLDDPSSETTAFIMPDHDVFFLAIFDNGITEPFDFTATAIKSNMILLEWDYVSADEAGFEIERFDGVWTPIGRSAPNFTFFVDRHLDEGTEYEYRLRVYDRDGSSSGWVEASAITFSPGDAIPSSFTPLATLRYVPPGTFTQGSPDDEPCRKDNEGPQFEHTLTNSIAVMETTITNYMWDQLYNTVGDEKFIPNPSSVSVPDDNHPVNNMYWWETILFANVLSELEGLLPVYYSDPDFTIVIDRDNYLKTGTFYLDPLADGYRLPTEAEYEYFTRAGTETPFYVDVPDIEDHCNGTPGDLPELDAIATFRSGRFPNHVGIKDPNIFNLYDTIGNMQEWCWDGYYEYTPEAKTDFINHPDRFEPRIVRNGSFLQFAGDIRSARRTSLSPGFRRTDIGFRLVRTLHYQIEGDNFTNQVWDRDSVVGNLIYVHRTSNAGFMQGSPLDEPCREDYPPYYHDRESQFPHILTRDIAVMQTEVSRGMWNELWLNHPFVPADPSISDWSPTMDHPVQNLQWREAVFFANLLSEYHELEPVYTDRFGNYIDGRNYLIASQFNMNWDATGYRLPTEAEWEYFARAKTDTPFSIDEPNYTDDTCNALVEPGELPNLESVATFIVNSYNQTTTVGHRLPNQWKIYDVHGNVKEWCWDPFSPEWNEFYPPDWEGYDGEPVIDWIHPNASTYRIIRGGCLLSKPKDLRSASRIFATSGDSVGFRLVRTIMEE